jgi:type I restriction enzyme S subunit
MMNRHWPTVKLGDVLKRAKDEVDVEDHKTYARLTIRMNGKGIVQRDRVPGHEIGTKRQFTARAGQLVLSKIDARNGAFGILPPECDNAIITGNFWAFDADKERLLATYFDYLTRTPLFVEFCVRASEGTTNRLYLQEDEFLAQDIVLPPLSEQQRVVERIENLVAHLREMNAIRVKEDHEIRQLLLAAFHRVTAGAPRVPMREVAPLVRRPITVDNLASYLELGIRSFGKGTFHKPALSGLEVGNKRIFFIEPGDLLFSNVFAWEGAIAVVQPEDVGRVGSHRYITCVPRSDLATSPFLCFYFLTREGMEQIGAASPGAAGRNRTLGLAALEEIEIPLPTMSEQLWFDELQSEVRALASVRAETAIELDALMPSILLRAFNGEL